MNLLYNVINVFCIIGPTGIGKSSISVDLCELLPVEIISIDSMLIYRYMDIGTSKPSKYILSKYNHYLIDIIDPSDCYSVKDNFYNVLNKIFYIYFIKRKIPLLVGGSMMYFNVLFDGLFNLPSKDNTVREYINFLFNIYGNEYVYNILKNIDYNSYLKINVKDRCRIIRNLEVFYITGKPYSSFLNEFNKYKILVNFKKIFIFPYNKLNLFIFLKLRFKKMLFNGFKREVSNLYYRGDLTLSMNSINSIGYRHMWLYLDNKINFVDMYKKVIYDNIHLVKKQLTWMKKIMDKYSLVLISNDVKILFKIFYYIVKYNNNI